MSMSIDPSVASIPSQNSPAAEVQVSVLKKAMDLQSDAVLKLLASALPPPALASDGSIGTQLNTHA